MADIFKINGNDYECEFVLSNDDTDEDINISKSAVKGLELEENIFMPFTNASITINNPYDYIEKDITVRGDGLDTFKFSIKHVDAPDTETLHYKFVIDNENNITSEHDRSQNYKTYRLLDDKYFALNREIPFGRRYSGKVGDIIKRILQDVVGEDSVDLSNWEDGDNEITKLPEYIIPPIGFKYSDLILYLLRMYYFKDGDIHVRGLLLFNRVAQKYQLVPVSKIYTEHSDRLIEAFGIGDLVDSPEMNKNNPPPEAKVNVYTNQLKNADITTPMLKYSNEYFMNGVVSGYDPILGEHYEREVRVEDLKDKWKSKFVDIFPVVGGSPKPFLVLNKSKIERQFRVFSFPFNIEKCKHLVEAEMTSNFCFYNLQLIIDNIGNTARESGKFIDIYKAENEDVKVDSKLLGRWLITKVKHIFRSDKYSNIFVCSKTYIGSGPEPDDGATLK